MATTARGGILGRTRGELDRADARRPGPRGGKAAGLDRLLARGLPVPPYAVVSPGEAAPTMPPGRYAVRSSALDEDGQQRSHAGEYLTRLDVPAEGVAAAVAEVAASGRAPLPVIVQAMVRARLAGVVFTADPRSGDVERTVVEWTEGLGDALVSGHVSPSRAEFASEAPPPLPGPVAEAARAAASLGGAVDVEWAWGRVGEEAEERLWLLQARPITTACPRRLALTNMNVRELFPETLRPLSEDVTRWVERLLLGPLLDPLGFDAREARLMMTVRGRPYFVMNALVAWMGSLPVLRWLAPARLAVLLGGGELALTAALARLRPQDLPSSRASGGRALRGGLAFLGGLLRHRDGRAEAVLGRTKAQTRALDVDPTRLDDGALLAHVADCQQDIDTAGMLPAAAVGFLCAGVAEALGRRWGLPAGRWLATRGTAGGDAGAALRALDAGADLSAFLAAWGHRGPGEMDVALPRWSERPALLRAQLAQGTRAPPAEEAEPTGPRAALLRAIARRGATGLGTREAFKDDIVRRLSFLRRSLLEIGRRLTARGWLGAPEEVFFLRLDELRPALAGALPDLAARMDRWAADRLAPDPPGVLVLGDAGWRLPESALPAGALRGLPASPGRARGRARLRAHGDLRPIDPGDVLVAPFTDPGWTVLLAAAGAVVTDFGGVLSHASIIARELRVPAVVNCGDATRRIPEGALVEVDGDRGAVTVLPEGEGG